MGERVASSKGTRQSLLKRLESMGFQTLSDREMRIVRVRVPGRDMTMAHLIGTSFSEIYRNLALNIGVHAGEDHTGESIGIMKFTPWECTVVAADIAVKTSDVEIGFLDRFNGTVIILGDRADIREALEEVRKFFRDELRFHVCEIQES